MHLDFLDGVRGIGILLVVACHGFYYSPTGSNAQIFAGKLLATGWIGVPIFFVLSGFVISYPFIHARTHAPLTYYLPGYASRRLLKIVPPFYAAILFFFCFYYARYGDATYLRDGLAWAIGLPNLVFTEPRFNPASWSLIVEAHFYMTLPLLLLATRGWNAKTTARGLFMILLIVPLLGRLVFWPENGTVHQLGFITHRFPNSLDYFGWGVLFSGILVDADVAQSTRKRLAMLGYVGVILLVLVVFIFATLEYILGLDIHPTRWSVELYHFLPAMASFLVLFFAFDPQSFGSRVLAWPVLRFVGIVSYEWYLFHQPILLAFRDWSGGAGQSIIRYLMIVLVPMGLTFLFAVLLYRFFSLPILQWGRNRLRGK